MTNTLLANLILFLHFFYVSFIVIGLAIIYLGYFMKWVFIRNPVFRWIHLSAMAIVIVEVLFGIFCPLTEWEAELRGAQKISAYSSGFIPYWVHHLLFYNWSPWVFELIYILLFLFMIVSMFIVPPSYKRRK
ncbi:MAG TPA: DUF2784 domain-containing protein [Deltaproteobacteria bacterium]|nr:DUF2784 domain-containing protein [Deltaproteobacteria bacterium]